MHFRKKDQAPDAHQQAVIIGRFVREVGQQIALPTPGEAQAIWAGLRNFVQLSVEICAQASSTTQET